MPFDLKIMKKISHCGENLLLFFILTTIYALSFTVLPYKYDHQTGLFTSQAVVADDSDSGSDDGGDGSESGGEDNGGESGESGSDDGGGGDGNGGDNDSGGDADDGEGSGEHESGGDADDGSDFEDKGDKDTEDANEVDSDRKDSAYDHPSENDNRRDGHREGDRFDFGDLDDLEPMTVEEEAGVVGNWDQ